MNNVAVREGKVLSKVIKVEEKELKDHLDKMVLESVEQTLNALLEHEADSICHAGRYERSPDRLDTRAGTYRRKLHTKTGEVTLKVPRLRKLPLETQIIERYRKRESSVEEAMIEMYLAGVSVRRVEDITEALWGTKVSPATVSRLNQKIYDQIEEWRKRRIEGVYSYIYLDGISLRRGKKCVSFGLCQGKCRWLPGNTGCPRVQKRIVKAGKTFYVN